MNAPPERRISLLAVGLFYAALGGVAFVASWFVFDSPPVRVADVTKPVALSVAVGAVVGLLTVGLTRITSTRFAWARRLDKNFQRLLGDVAPMDAAVMALTSGLAEEMLFRGFLLRLFLPRVGVVGLGEAALAIALSSIAFGLLHIGPDRSYLPWTVFATLLGAVFASVTLWTGDITAAVVAHLTINYFNFLAIGRGPVD